MGEYGRSILLARKAARKLARISFVHPPREKDSVEEHWQMYSHYTASSINSQHLPSHSDISHQVLTN